MNPHYEKFEAIREKLRPIAAKHKIKDAYWLDGSDAPEDYPFFCEECAEKERAKIVEERRKAHVCDPADVESYDSSGNDDDEFEVLCEKCGGVIAEIGVRGDEGNSEDGDRFCETCGVELDVSYTEYAVEMLVLEACAKEGLSPNSPDVAHALLRALDAIEYSEDKLMVKCAAWICENVK